MLKLDTVRAVPINGPLQLNGMANWGPDVWYTNSGTRGIFHVNLETGESDTAAGTAHFRPWDIDTNGEVVVWAEQRFLGADKAEWQIDKLDIASGQISVIDSADSPWHGPLSGIRVPVDVSGDLVAYAVGAPTTLDEQRSTIVVRRLSTNEVVRTIETEDIAFDLAVDDGTVAYTESKVDPESNNVVHDTQLVLSTSDAVDPAVIAQHTFTVALDRSTLAWESMPDSGEPAANAVGVVVAATLPQGKPVVLSSAETLTGQARANKPVAADGWVSWTELRAGAGHLMVSDRGFQRTAEIAQAEAFIWPSVGGGWLAWESYLQLDGNEGEAFLGTALADIPPF
jgi:hypothetical protein